MTEITPGNALQALPGITDPVARAFACDDLLARKIPELQAAIAEVRRAAVYDATLRPGANADTVAAELGVSNKAISKAVSEQRHADRELMREALASVLAAPPGGTLALQQAYMSRSVPDMARRLLDFLGRPDVELPGPGPKADAVARGRERAETILDGHDDE